MYALSSAVQETAQQRKKKLPTTRAERAAYVKEHRCIPPELLPPAEQRRLGLEVSDDHERSAPWLVDPILAPIIKRNSGGALGWCNATESTLRAWAYEQSGHVFGERSISRWLRQQAERGALHRKRIPAGGYFHKTKMRTRNGTTINRFPSEQERRERLWREKHERRRQRREARARKRAERTISRSKSHVEDVELHPPQEKILSALPVVMSAAERASLFAMPSFLADAIEPHGGSLSDAQLAERRREVEKQLAAAHALTELWDDEPPE